MQSISGRLKRWEKAREVSLELDGKQSGEKHTCFTSVGTG